METTFYVVVNLDRESLASNLWGNKKILKLGVAG